MRGGWSWGVTGACGWGVLRWVFPWGALVVSWRPVDGDGGRVWGAEQVTVERQQSVAETSRIQTTE